MKKTALLLIAITLSMFFSCKEEVKSENHFNEEKEIVNEEQNLDGHTSINTLDWAGTYEGTLSCSNCDANLIEITISTDNTFIMNSTSINDGKKTKKSDEGLFQWDESGSAISFDVNGKTLNYKVAENQLILLDKEGNVRPESTTDNFSLMKKTISQNK